ncbi:MAG TPA: type I glyceraldehyde-3-phosphate dehydrogenase [Candidatus Micrarchaeaceae archaeon]|nr:type I glyceraldehyde-3-phosphate dehydrogenase [Candidatus Micrarchaeaceae archaeon]
MATRVGINGFGRIGRNLLRAAREYQSFEIVAANDLGTPESLAHLLRYDSTLGRYPGEVVATAAGMVVDGRELKIFSKSAPGDIDWAGVGVEVVIESSGLFTQAEQARQHIEQGGARKVIITAPAQGEDITICMGVNEGRYQPSEHQIISNASCTTNCLAPVAKVIYDNFGIESGLMMTVHAYTGDQRLLDTLHRDPRRARAAALSVIPTSSGAAEAVAKVLPELAGRFRGIALRVPVPDVSIVDFAVVTTQPTTAEAINAALRAAAESDLRGILRVEDEPLVSADFRGDSHSSVVDSQLTLMVGEHHAKVLAWYDNEWGYSCRVADLIQLVATTLPPVAR